MFQDLTVIVIRSNIVNKIRVLYCALKEPVIYACPHFYPVLFSGQLLNMKKEGKNVEKKWKADGRKGRDGA